MRWNDCHLTYCLNVHPGEGLSEVLAAIRGPAAEVKGRICPDEPFGLGLRLSAEAVRDMEPDAARYRREFDKAGMYAFTINGFPYGRFHGASVKTEVYEPDWTRPERLSYTRRLARVLADLLPEGVAGSISTVPLGYGGEIRKGAIDNLLQAALTCRRLLRETGREVVLALEPEPDCLLSTTDDVLEFWPRLRRAGDETTLRHLGVCLDCCHAACEFERPADSLRRLEEAGIRVPKIQISAAPRLPAGTDPIEALSPFDEDVYLHQTRVCSNGEGLSFPDLPAALEQNPPGEWRVHFHVPLHFAAPGNLATTADLLDEEFLTRALTPGRHLEIETYSFHVLPGGGGEVVDSICGEFRWLMDRAR
jgi:sugar phosphate isomerase/epimerase